jgi:hypothetical protein
MKARNVFGIAKHELKSLLPRTVLEINRFKYWGTRLFLSQKIIKILKTIL